VAVRTVPGTVRHAGRTFPRKTGFSEKTGFLPLAAFFCLTGRTDKAGSNPVDTPASNPVDTSGPGSNRRWARLSVRYIDEKQP
jgi:hypothetical protein